MSSFRKKNPPMVEYFNKIKMLVDTLASIGHPVQDEEVATYILTGLDADYDALVTSITTRPDPISLDDLYAHLVNYDVRREHNESVM